MGAGPPAVTCAAVKRWSGPPRTTGRSPVARDAAESRALIPWILPSILIGVPIGAAVIRHVPPETFRRVCLSFDAWIVGFGLSTLLRQLRIVPGPSAFLVLAAVIVIDAWLLYRFFSRTVR